MFYTGDVSYMDLCTLNTKQIQLFILLGTFLENSVDVEIFLYQFISSKSRRLVVKMLPLLRRSPGYSRMSAMSSIDQLKTDKGFCKQPKNNFYGMF